MKRFFAALLDLLYPPKCVFCARVLETGHGVCPDCLKMLPRTKNGGARKVSFLRTVYAPLYYEGDVRASLHRFKFGGVAGYAGEYAALMKESLDEGGAPEFELISWVPLSRKRLRQRGYDQARLLAEELSRLLGAECVSLLQKTRHVPPQSRTGGAAARRANIAGCYRVTDAAQAAGKRILLVDDIVTTGATLSECARMLGMAGAESVYGVAVAASRD